uniref:Uncharacterized protein n=1 Tax=Anguilla anguilla TaxID=7936 RepID=A0A0E9X5Y7_ANGAN
MAAMTTDNLHRGSPKKKKNYPYFTVVPDALPGSSKGVSRSGPWRLALIFTHCGTLILKQDCSHRQGTDLVLDRLVMG